MRQGGLIAVATPSRHDSPETRPRVAEDAAHLRNAEPPAGAVRGAGSQALGIATIELPSARAVRDYLAGKQVAPDRAQAVAVPPSPQLTYDPQPVERGS